MLKTETIPYQSDDVTLEGYLVYDDSHKKPRPGILVAHAWKGQDAFARRKAEKLAELGYIGFAADVYGRGIYAETDDEALSLMTPLFRDRQHLRKRIYAAYHTLSELEQVDQTRMGAIGYCFGGLTVLELLRSGADLKGTVSFHGLLGTQLGDLEATIPTQSEKLHGSVLLLHGNNDPLVSKEDVHNIQFELTEASVDWQMHIYGNVSHAFTNPEAKDPKSGLIYNQKADQRSWQSMKQFFEEKF